MPLVYIGTDTFKSSSKGVYGARFNAATGQLSAPTLAAETVRPSYLASARVGGRWVLYAANEGSSEHDSGISSYTIDPLTGTLSLLNKVASGGAGPCYVSVDGTASSAFAANYAGSSVASFKVQPGGALSEPVEHIDFKQAAFGHHGPNSAQAGRPASALGDDLA